MSVVLFLYIWGSSSAYLIILGDCFQPLLLQAFGDTWFTKRDMVISFISCACILPLCFPRRLTALAGVSALTLYGLFVVVGAIVYRSVQIVKVDPSHWGQMSPFSPSWEFLAALPIFVFGFQCHTNVIAVFDEMDDDPVIFRTPSSQSLAGEASSAGEAPGAPSGPQVSRALHYTQLPVWSRSMSRRKLKSPKLMGMVWVVITAIGITCFFYCAVGVFGYLAFLRKVDSNILLNFAPDDRMMQVARGVVGLLQVASYPVLHNPARAAVQDLIYQVSGRRCAGDSFYILETLVFFGSTLAVAMMVTDLGVVFRLVGGTGGGLLIFTLPGLLLMQYAYGKHLLSRQAPTPDPLLPHSPLVPQGGRPAAAAHAHQEESNARERGCGGQLEEEEAPCRSPRAGSPSWPPLTQPLLGGAAPGRLLPGRSIGSPTAGRRVYSYWTSKLWWSGIALVLLSGGLCAVTVYTVFAPPLEG